MSEYEMKCYEGDEPRINVTDEFVEKNGFKIDLSAAKRILKNRQQDFLGFQTEVASGFLPWEQIKEIYKEEYVEKVASGEEEHPKQVTDVKEAVQDFLDYMVFAWKKAMDERGISASRSIQKLSAWMEILGRNDVAEVLQDEGLYAPYGRPALRKACEMLEIKVPEYL